MAGSLARLQLRCLPGHGLITKLDWGETHFQVHVLVGKFQVPWTTGWRPSASWQLPTWCCSRSPEGFWPKATLSPLTRGSVPHGPLLYQTQRGSPRMTVYNIMSHNLGNTIPSSLPCSFGRNPSHRSCSRSDGGWCRCDYQRPGSWRPPQSPVTAPPFWSQTVHAVKDRLWFNGARLSS